MDDKTCERSALFKPRDKIFPGTEHFGITQMMPSTERSNALLRISSNGQASTLQMADKAQRVLKKMNVKLLD